MRPPPTELKAVFFDLDDTLCDYTTAAVTGRRDAFALLRGHCPPDCTVDYIDEVYLRAFKRMIKESKHGGPWRSAYLTDGWKTRHTTMGWMLTELGIENSELAERISNRYHELRRERLALYADSLPVLNATRERYVVGLITNGPADIQRDEIEVLGVAPYFDHIFIEGEQVLGKPHPSIFESAMKAAGVNANQMIYVGNSLSSDVAGANNAGVFSVWLNRLQETRTEHDPVPDLELPDLRAFADWLGLNVAAAPAGER